MRQRLLYWIPTTMLVLMMGSGGVFDIMSPPGALEIMYHLGYPSYFAPMLGVAKILGVVGILAPVPRTVREWAYAGFTFELIAAVVSHVNVDGITKVGPALLGLVFVAGSYLGWRKRLAGA